MDGVSAAASVAGIVTTALQSCKVIYQAISAIRGRPKQIDELSTSISCLDRILYQLAKLIDRAEQLGGSQDAAVFEALPSFLAACAKDLSKLQAKLSKLEGNQRNRMQKSWSLAKHVLKPDEFRTAHDMVSKHLQVLSMQLSIAGSQLHLNHGITLNTIGQITAQTYINTAPGLPAIGQHDDVSGAVHEETGELRKDVDRVQHFDLQTDCVVADKLLTKLGTLPSASSPQHDEIIHLLQEIQQQLQHQKSSGHKLSNPSRNTHGGLIEELNNDSQQHVEANENLEAIDAAQTLIESKPGITETGLSGYINRLCLLSSNERGTVASEVAESIIDDLESLLIEVTRFNQHTGNPNQHSTKRKASVISHENCCSEQGIKRVRRALANSRILEISQVAPRRPSAQRTGLKNAHQGSLSFDVQGGSLMISYSAKTSNDVQSPEDYVETLDGTLSLLMPHQPHRVKLNVWFSQKVRGLQFDVLPSTISFQCVRPDESVVFHLASFGSVEDLVELFEAGDASLSDCDSKGRSLLNYALRRLNVSVCKFLVEHHADVDSFASLIGGGDQDQLFLPLAQAFVSDYELDTERLSASLKCQKILLEAGSDPTLPASHYSSFLAITIQGGSLETLRLYLDQSSHFIDLETRNQAGETYLMQLICSYAFAHSNQASVPAKTLLLLERGADIHARDLNNAGCFHVLFRWSLYGRVDTNYPRRHFYEYVLLLLDQGGDAFTPSRYGISPTAVALMVGFGTLWFRALVECYLHYDLSSVLAKDHAMWHRWVEIESSRGDHQHKKRSGQRDITECRDESNSTSNPFANSVDYGYRSSRTYPMQFYQCSDPDCGWQVWDYLEILSTTPFPTGCGKVIIDWAFEGHTHDFLSQSTYFCGCIACNFSHSSRESDEMSDGITDPMDDDLEQESPQSTKEDFDLAATPRVYPTIITQDVVPADSTTFRTTLQQKHPCLEDNSSSPIASVSDHQSPDSSGSKLPEHIACTQDQTMHDRASSLEPWQSIETDPQLWFNPWD